MIIPLKLAFLWVLQWGIIYAMWRSSGFLPSPGEDQERLPQGSQLSAEAGKIRRSRPGAEGACAHVCTSGCGSMCVGARPWASSCLQWALGKAVRNTCGSKVHAEVKKMCRKTSKISSGQITQRFVSHDSW